MGRGDLYRSITTEGYSQKLEDISDKKDNSLILTAYLSAIYLTLYKIRFD